MTDGTGNMQMTVQTKADNKHGHTLRRNEYCHTELMKILRGSVTRLLHCSTSRLMLVQDRKDMCMNENRRFGDVDLHGLGSAPKIQLLTLNARVLHQLCLSSKCSKIESEKGVDLIACFSAQCQKHLARLHCKHHYFTTPL